MEESKLYINGHGDRIWYLPSKGKQHLHRTDGPAYELTNGSKYWFVNDKQHRLGAPAVEHADGSKFWKENGELHRIDGPAVDQIDGSKFWWINGKRHRIDGPAIEWLNGSEEWWIDGKNITEEIEEWIKEFNIDVDTNEGKMRFKLVWV